MKLFLTSLFFILITNASAKTEEDKFLDGLYFSRQVGKYVGECLYAEFLSKQYCKDHLVKNNIYLSKIPKPEQCEANAFEFIANIDFFYKNEVVPELEEISINNKDKKESFRENMKDGFNETLDFYSNDIKKACEYLQKTTLNEYRDRYKKLFIESSPYYFSEIDFSSVTGEYYEIDAKRDVDSVLKAFNKNKDSALDDQQFLAFLAIAFDSLFIFSDSLLIELKKKLLNTTKYTKVKDFINTSLNDITKYNDFWEGQDIGSIRTLPEHLKNVPTNLSNEELFRIALETYKHYIDFKDNTLITFEINDMHESLFYIPDHKPLNRLEKIKGIIKNDELDFTAVINILEISHWIDLPSNLKKGWYEFSEKLGRNAGEKNYIKEILENWKNNYPTTKAPLWIEKNKKYRDIFLKHTKFKNLDELKQITINYIEIYQENVSIALAKDLLIEATIMFNGDSSANDFVINEFAAQTLAEQALKVAKIEQDNETIEDAKTFLGSLFLHSFNENIKNNRLGKIHLEDNLHFWIEECSAKFNSNSSHYLIDCYKDDGSLLEISVESISNVLKLIYENENLFDHGPITAQLNEIYKSESPFIDHVTISLEKPSTFNSSNDYIAYLDNQIQTKNDLRIIDLKCDYMLDRNEKYDIDTILECFNTAKNKYLTTDSSAIYDSSLDWYNNEIDRIEKVKNEQFVLLDDFDLNEYFSYKDKESHVLSNDQIQNSTNNKKYALLIGNSDYDAKLESPVNDVNNLEKVLQDVGFETFKYENLSLAEFKDAIIEFGLTTKNSDITLFYYSGHAYEVGGLNYLLPVDIDFSDSATKNIPLSIELNKLMQRNLSGKTKLIFLDACRNNPFNKNGLAVVNLGNNTLISYAAGFNQYSYDGKEMSPYTNSLVKNIKTNVPITETLRKVRKEVKEFTNNKQIPEEYSNLDEVLLY